MNRSRLAFSLLLAGWLAPLGAAAEAVAVDASIAPYKTVSGVAGNLNSIGSDTRNNVMTLWAETFRAKYPNVRIQIEGNRVGVRDVPRERGILQYQLWCLEQLKRG